MGANNHMKNVLVVSAAAGGVEAGGHGRAAVRQIEPGREKEVQDKRKAEPGLPAWRERPSSRLTVHSPLIT